MTEKTNRFQTERLYDYTKFHVNMYAVLIGGLLTAANLEEVFIAEPYKLLIPAALFALSGACAGLICTTCTYCTEDTIAHAQSVKWLGFIPILNLKILTHLEHLFFWIGIVSAFAVVM